MNVHGGGFNVVATRKAIALLIDHHNIVRTDLGPEQTARIDQETLRSIRQLDTEMIADALAQPVVRCRTQSEREVFSQLPDCA
jgi:hypothetical protein